MHPPSPPGYPSARAGLCKISRLMALATIVCIAGCQTSDKPPPAAPAPIKQEHHNYFYVAGGRPGTVAVDCNCQSSDQTSERPGSLAGELSQALCFESGDSPQVIFNPVDESKAKADRAYRIYCRARDMVKGTYEECEVPAEPTEPQCRADYVRAQTLLDQQVCRSLCSAEPPATEAEAARNRQPRNAQ